jgi:hypothetical protein
LAPALLRIIQFISLPAGIQKAEASIANTMLAMVRPRFTFPQFAA